MIITYHGGECFKVSSGNLTLVFNPIAKGSNFPAVKFGADIAFVSLNHPDFNGIEQVTYGERVPFVVSGPGEYEIGEVTARGWGVQTTYDGISYFNTIYQVTLEGITLLFLGALSQSSIDAKILQELGDVDILFVPVGGGDVLDPSAASALGVKLEPHLIIPMHYDTKTLAAFLKEEGADGVKPEEKLTVKKKDLLEKEGDILVLKN
ncbi:MBL fold metallo-hydrolase [Candidatus Kaiserbacteria bacterium]|nr:MBL fold metallo-hydrolase [Candidatus Kaiserbacteria bacterium]